MHCTASPHAVAKYVDMAGEAAMEGTAAHLLLETCLVEGKQTTDFLGHEIKVSQGNAERTFQVDREMAYMVDDAGVRPVRELTQRPGISRVEVSVALPHIDPDLFGRVDAFHFSPETRILSVFDFKYGRLDVAVENNPQLMLYALGIWRQYFAGVDLDVIDFYIGQPRSLVPGPAVKRWRCEGFALEEFEREVRVAVGEVRRKPVYAMGQWCKYCPALGDCPASQKERSELSHALAAVDMNVSDAVKVMRLAPLLEAKIKSAERALFGAMMAGHDIEGWGLFTQKKHRTWRDVDLAKDRILEVFGPQAMSVPTPAQVERLGADGKKIVAELSTTPEGSPVAAPRDDKRSPWVRRSATEIFGGILP